MDSNLKGNIGESVALNYFLKNGYEVYVPFGTATSCDMIVFRDGISLRVSVKSGSRQSRNGKYEINIRQQVKRKSVPFKQESCDILFLYVIPEDRFKILNSKDVTNKNIITI